MWITGSVPAKTRMNKKINLFSFVGDIITNYKLLSLCLIIAVYNNVIINAEWYLRGGAERGAALQNFRKLEFLFLYNLLYFNI